MLRATRVDRALQPGPEPCRHAARCQQLARVRQRRSTSEIVAAGNGQSFGEPGRELIDADVRVPLEGLKEAPRAAEACTACA